jgi:CHAT domain-containing protein
LTREWIPSGCGHEFGSATNYDLGFEWQSATQLGAQVRLTDPVADHEGPGRADIDNVAVLQLFRENAWLEGLVASDVHAPQKNDLRHRLISPLTIGTQKAQKAQSADFPFALFVLFVFLLFVANYFLLYAWPAILRKLTRRDIVMRLRAWFALSIVLGVWLIAEGQTESPVLELRKTDVYDIQAGRSQEHYLLLRAGQYARIHITQQTVNIAVAVFDPAGKPLFALEPFAALPEPGKQAPLMVDHEIITAPSASVLSVLRQETAGRESAGKTLYVVADPVYSANDDRVGQRSVLTVAQRAPGGTDRIQSGAEGNKENFLRLRFSRTEAEQIANLIPAESTVKALDFDANRDAVLKADLLRFRILHFATHSVIDDERPELSGIVLSLVNRAGRRQDGLLRLYDVYNLRLNSDLVVLSACRTALGQEIKGEGLIGLTRGFFYAGAPRVLASLWQIDDRTTAAFMRPFYESMLVRHERPAAALRSAQIEMWKTKGWEAPYYWAAFTMQGEWK